MASSAQGENPAESLTMEEKKTRAAEISGSRILTQEDFKVSLFHWMMRWLIVHRVRILRVIDDGREKS